MFNNDQTTYPKPIRAGYTDYKRITFGWDITDWCNYKCDYCSAREDHVDKFDRKRYRKTQLPIQLRVIKYDFDIELGGGEPTIHPYFKEIVEQLDANQYCRQILLNTNLSRSLRFYKSLNRTDKWLFSASYHPDYHSDEFLEKCLELNKSTTSGIFACLINISDKQEHWENTKYVIEFCRKNKIRYELNKLYSTPYRTINYPQNTLEFFDGMVDDSVLKYPYEFEDKKQTFLGKLTIEANGLNSFTGYRCRALKYKIDFDGNVRGHCDDRVVPLFPKEQDLFRTITCNREACECLAMFNYYKERQ